MLMQQRFDENKKKSKSIMLEVCTSKSVCYAQSCSGD